jgi:hypothetical protein
VVGDLDVDVSILFSRKEIKATDNPCITGSYLKKLKHIFYHDAAEGIKTHFW